MRTLAAAVCCVLIGAVSPGAEAERGRSMEPPGRPNVLFLAVDDLNHWVKHLGRNPQVITPHIDRLAGRGITFTRAYCAAPACNPSRAALMSGMRPSSTGVYSNPDDWRKVIRPELTLNVHFRKQGYHVAGVGKIYHGGTNEPAEWDEYHTPSNKVKPRGQKGGGAAGAIKFAELLGDDDVMNDYHVVSWAIEQLGKKHEKPFFLACGIFRPHLPWSVPKRYFDLYPEEEIQLPPFREDDLDDIPAAGVRVAGPQGDHARVTKAGLWKKAVRAYLASISFADAQVGRLLEALEKSPYRDNTIVVLWGDHGWHLGEKSHWRKFALWEEATRAPLIWIAPGVTKPGSVCDRPVDFLSIYPTLCDLCGIETPGHLQGVSLRRLLEDPNAKWKLPAITTHKFQNHAIRSGNWRYIRYADGSEELYDHEKDPYEWTNLAGRAELAEIQAELARHLPRTNRKPAPVRRGAR